VCEAQKWWRCGAERREFAQGGSHYAAILALNGTLPFREKEVM